MIFGLFTPAEFFTPIWLLAMIFMALLLCESALMLLNPPGPPNAPARSMEEAQRWARWDVHSRLAQTITGAAYVYLLMLACVVMASVVTGFYFYALGTVVTIVGLWRVTLTVREVIHRQEQDTREERIIARVHPNDVDRINDHARSGRPLKEANQSWRKS